MLRVSFYSYQMRLTTNKEQMLILIYLII